jgi:hypothetical protein
MFKKITLLTIFISIFLFSPIKSVYADLDKNIITDQEKDTRPWYVKFWADAENFLFRLLTGKDSISREFEFTSGKSTDYLNFPVDYSFRNLPKKTQDRLKGIWFYEVVTKAVAIGDDGKEQIKYTDDLLSETPNGCSKNIKISDIVYYFKTKTQKKILYTYESGGQPIDYPQMDAITLENEDNCYELAYKKIQSIPKGEFLPDADWGGGNGKNYYLDSTTTSIQYNNLTGINLPQKYQAKDTPPNNSTQKNIEKLILIAKEQEITTNFVQMPQKGKELSGIGEWIYDTITLDSGKAGFDKDPDQPDNVLRHSARLWLTPKKWQEQKNTTTTANKNKTEETNLTMIYRQKTTTDKPNETNLNIVYNN